MYVGNTVEIGYMPYDLFKSLFKSETKIDTALKIAVDSYNGDSVLLSVEYKGSNSRFVLYSLYRYYQYINDAEVDKVEYTCFGLTSCICIKKIFA